MLQFEAVIDLLATAEGGRRSPVRSGYRGTVHAAPLYTTGVFQFLEDRGINPGETVRASVCVVSGNEFLAALPRDRRFEVTEGGQVVGHGRMVGDPVAPPSEAKASLTRS